MSRGKNFPAGGTKRRRGESSDDSDEDFVVDHEEDEEDDDDDDYDDDNCEDSSDAAAADDDDDHEEDDWLSGSEDWVDLDSKIGIIRWKKPGRKLSGCGFNRKRKRGRVSHDDAEEEEDDEDFEPGSEYSTEDEEESVVVTRNSVKKKVTGIRRRKGRRRNSTDRRKKVRKSIADRKRKSNNRRAALLEEEEEEEETALSEGEENDDDDYDDDDDDDFVVDEENASRKKIRFNPKAKKKRSRQTKRSETPSDLDSLSDSDFIVSDEEIDIPRGVLESRILATRSIRSPGLKREQVAGDLDKREQNGRTVKFVVEADRIECKGKEKLTDLCKQVCGICLSEEWTGTVRGKLNCCDHFFCFICIMEWSKVESRCPMCKQRFDTIDKSSSSGICLRNVTISVPCRNQVYQPSEEELRGYLDPYANIVCIECHQGGDDNLMLLCDICDSSAHTYCVGLGMEVPEGNWYCEGCKTSDPGSSNSQARQNCVQEQFAGSTLCSEDSTDGDVLTPSNPSSECLRTPVSQPSGQGTAVASRFPVCGDSGTTSLTLGAGVSTVMGRRRLRRQIHSILSSNRMSETPYYIEVTNRLLNASCESDSIKFEERDGIDKEQFGRLEHDRSHVDLDNESGRFVSCSIADSFGENSSRHMQRINCLSPSLGCLGRVTQFPDNSSPRNLDGENMSIGQPNIVRPRAVWYEEMQDLEERPRIVSNSDIDSSQVHDTKEQVCSLVKRHLKSLVKDGHIERCEFKDIARRSTHTILAAHGIKCSKSQGTLVRPPSCNHIADGFTLGILINECCSKCFNGFICDVVDRIAKTRD